MREEQNKKTSQKVIKMLRKRWVVPAIYLVSAAVILTGALWYQYSNAPTSTNPTETSVDNKEPDAVPVTQTEEKLTYPVAEGTAVQVKSHFYDDSASEKEQQNSLIQMDSKTFTINTGMDLVDKSGKEFGVTAALSGTVTKAQKDAQLGFIVVVDNGNGLVSYYQSLKSVSVEPGTKVSQGDAIGTAGTALIGKEIGNHVHFELRKDGVAINPEKYQGQAVSSIISTENTKTESKDSNTMNTSGSVSDDKKEDSTDKNSDSNKIQE